MITNKDKKFQLKQIHKQTVRPSGDKTLAYKNMWCLIYISLSQSNYYNHILTLIRDRTKTRSTTENSCSESTNLLQSHLFLSY